MRGKPVYFQLIGPFTRAARMEAFRPIAEGKYPVILSYGPYAKGLSFQEGYKANWARLTKAAPEVLEGSSNKKKSGSHIRSRWLILNCSRVALSADSMSSLHLDGKLFCQNQFCLSQFVTAATKVTVGF